MVPALPFPNSDEDGSLPANGNTEALWTVRPLQPGDRSIEVIANALNEANQLRAAARWRRSKTTSRPRSAARRCKYDRRSSKRSAPASRKRLMA